MFSWEADRVHLNHRSLLFWSSADPRKPLARPLGLGLERNAASAVTARGALDARWRGLEALTRQLVCNLDALSDRPREAPPVGHLTCNGSTFLSHSITIPRTRIRRCETLKRAQMHTMMHYYNEKWHVQGPEAPLNQHVGGNSTDLLKTSDLLKYFPSGRVRYATESRYQ